MPLPPLASVVREFWGHVSDGCTAAQAGVAVGVSESAGICWLREAGGVKPRLTEPTTSGPKPRLTLGDRIQIDIGVKTNESLNSIGRRLGRAASTIKREIDVNGGHHVARKSGYRRKEAFGARQSGELRRSAMTRSLLRPRSTRPPPQGGQAGRQRQAA